jgi:pyruvate dehydrogenase E2 component (dihydrolipoamide acetyltransferase)
MVFEFKLPDIGEGVHEGEIVKWLIKAGDPVKEDQPIVEVMTDKATVELTAPRGGKIAALHAKEGEVIKVGTVFVTIDEGSGSAKVEAPASEAPKTAAKKEEKTLFEGQAQVELVKRRKRSGAGPTTTKNGPVAHPAGRPLAAPAVRRAAREAGVDLASVQGSGSVGRITRQDLESYLESMHAAPTPVAAAPATRAPVGTTPTSSGWTSHKYTPGEKVPFRGLRRKINEALRASKAKASHFTYVEEVDATELVKLKDAAKPLGEQRGVALTFLPFIVKATVAALKAYPLVNSRLNEAEGVIDCLDEYHIGIAVATEAGLIVPVVKNADKKSIFQIAAEITELSAKTRSGKATRDELTGSTYTISSLGKLGGLLATPIINQPEVGIMGVHKIADRPVVRDGQIVVGKVMNLSFTFDHGVVDGSYGAEFAATVIKYLEDPKLLLLETA